MGNRSVGRLAPSKHTVGSLLGTSQASFKKLIIVLGLGSIDWVAFSGFLRSGLYTQSSIGLMLDWDMIQNVKIPKYTKFRPSLSRAELSSFNNLARPACRVLKKIFMFG